MSNNLNSAPAERFTYYEKFHLHDYVHHKDDHYSKTEVDGLLLTIEQDIKNVDDGLTAIETEIDDIDLKVSSLEIEMTDVYTKVEALEIGSTEINKDIAVLNSKTGTINKKIGEIVSEIAPIEDNTNKILAVESDMAFVKGSIAGLEDMENDIAALNHQVSGIQDNTNEIVSTKQTINLHDSRLGAIETVLSSSTFYKGKCKHNNDRIVKFYENSDVINHSANVSQSKGDFVSDSGSNNKLLIVKGGLYAMYFYDGYKCSSSSNLIIKLDKLVMNVNNSGWYDKKPLAASSSWQNMNYSNILEFRDNTKLEMYLDNNSGILDGQSYSRIALYKLI